MMMIIIIMAIMIGRKKTTERKSQMNDSDVDCRNKKKNNKCIKSA